MTHRNALERMGTYCAVAGALAVSAGPGRLLAQEMGGTEQAVGAAAEPVDSLVAIALQVNPTLRAAERAIDAARARIGPAGAPPDPMVGVGIMNFPMSEPGFGDFMTMTTIGVAQRLPFPGKLDLRRRAAELELRAAQARQEAARLDIETDVRIAWYELAFLERSLEVVEDNQALLVDLVGVTESRYGVGTGGQQDVLKARVETALLAEQAVALVEARRAALARLNALLDRPSATPVERPRIPERVARAAVSASPAEIRFTSAALGARAADSPLPPLEELEERAIAGNPWLRAHEAEIAAHEVRVELAGRAHLPDFDLSLQYGQRMDRADMVSVMVSVPVPVNRGDRQDQEVAEAHAELAAMQAGHHEMVNELRATVAEHYARLERDRAQLALFVRSIVPQGRAALESATAAFQVGRADFMTVVENQATLYDYEIAYFRTLTDFAKGLAELERVVGAEVLP
ncbi:MAG TPA: TolC family protein [Longimicrobiales bacterium]|nr:TolC family protein [Longimicrobiales bacterium]